MTNDELENLMEDMMIYSCNNDYIQLKRSLNSCRELYQSYKAYPAKLDLFRLLGNTISYCNLDCCRVLIDEVFSDHDSAKLFDIYADEYIEDAIESGNIDIVSLLLERIDINKENLMKSTPFHMCCRKGNIDCIKLLMDRNADINKKDSYGITPVALAAQSGDKDILNLLITNGATVEGVTNLEGESVLFFAVLHGNYECAALLLDTYPSLLHAKDYDEKSILHFAASRGHYDCVNLLLDRGCDIDEKDSQQYTSLHYGACQTKDPRVIEILIKRGASVNALEKYSKTPLHLACSQKNSSNNVKILLNAGALIDENAISSYTKKNIKLIMTELKNRGIKRNFDNVTDMYIEYLPYHAQLYKICYPDDHKTGVVPSGGWSEAAMLRDQYYHKEVVHLLHQYLANLYCNSQPILSSQIISSARNSNKVHLLMTKLKSYISAYLTIQDVHVHR